MGTRIKGAGLTAPRLKERPFELYLDEEGCPILKPPSVNPVPPEFRRVEGRRWNSDEDCWRLVGGERSLLSLIRVLDSQMVHAEGVDWPLDASQFQSLDTREVLTEFELVQTEAGAHPRTARTYARQGRRFLLYVGSTDREAVADTDFSSYVAELTDVWELGQSSINQVVSAVKQLYRLVFGLRPPRITGGAHPHAGRNKVAFVTSEAEANAMISACDSNRDRVLISLLFYGGLKLDEVRNLQVRDILFSRRRVRVRGTRGRMIPVPGHLWVALQSLISDCRPTWLLFQGSRPLVPLSVRRIQDIVRRAADRANIDSRNTPSALRNGCAIRLLNRGLSLKNVADVLGVTDRVIESYLPRAGRAP